MTAVPNLLETSVLVEQLRADVVGANTTIRTPFGLQPLVYADYTASGRALGCIEDAIREQVLPLYANTHSESSLTGAYSGALRESARATIRSAINARSNDCVIFAGSGATAAINRLVDVLELGRSTEAARPLPEALRPVVFIGPYEHHSNELPWRESVADVVRIGLDVSGRIDQQVLANALVQYQHRPLRIGSFSAASNVTGVISDVVGITRLLKANGALACWDYAAAGPYVPIDVNLAGAEIDAVFLSPHKFIGGPSTPGILVAKASLFKRARPAIVGGGTVAYVSPLEHRWVADREAREEGGTPAIVESIRAGLVFELKRRVGEDYIAASERHRAAHVWQTLATEPNIDVLGPDASVERLPIFSMRFKHGERWLHHGFVVALLNDLFGIQARGGCSCAGPYGHELLAIDAEASAYLGHAVAVGGDSYKPGWVRLNFHWLASDAECDYLLRALKLVAQHGAALLPIYELDWSTGVWRHKDAHPVEVPTMAALLSVGARPSQASAAAPTLASVLARAEQLLHAAGEIHRGGDSGTTEALDVPDANRLFESHRWFVLPHEVQVGSV